MLLIELLEQADENKIFCVKDMQGNIISLYDGKNSIDKALNNKTVKSYSIETAGDTTAIIQEV